MAHISFASIIILSWNGERFLRPCLQAVLAQTDDAVEVFVVDNASTDQSVAIAQSFAPRVRLIQNGTNLGFAGGNNVGIKAASGEVVILLNQDTVVQPGWLAAILETFADPTIGIVGCKALYPDGKTIQHAGARVRPGDAFTEHVGLGQIDEGQFDQFTDMDYVTGAAFAIHRRLLERVGGLDEEYYPAFYEEVDYCYCARRAGFRVTYQPRAIFYHYETTSLEAGSYSTQNIWHRNRIRFILRHWDRPTLSVFAQAEREAIFATSGANDMMARARAYFGGLLTLPQIAMQRQINTTLGEVLLPFDQRYVFETLQTLRQQLLKRIADAPHDFADTTNPPLSDRVSSDFSHLVGLLSEIERQVVLHEKFEPISPMPLFGPLVTWLRGRWLAIVVKPYLIPILALVMQVAQELARHAQLQEDIIQQQANAIQRQAQIIEVQVEILSGDDAALAELLPISGHTTLRQPQS